MKKLIGVLLGSLFLVFPLCANADIIGQVTLAEQASGPTQSVFFSSIGYNVTAYLDYQLSLNGGAYVGGFCVEGSWSPPGTFAYTLLSIDSSLFSNFSLNAQNHEAAAYVAQLWASGQIKDKAAAQIAIWEITTDGIGQLDLSKGSFYTVASAYTTEANDILAHLPGTFSDSNTWVLAVNPALSGVGPVGIQDYQNYMVPVPEPSTLLLLGAGLLGLGLAVRRRKR